MKNIYVISKKFLDNFDDLKSYGEISKRLEEICLCLLEKQNISKQIKLYLRIIKRLETLQQNIQIKYLLTN